MTRDMLVSLMRITRPIIRSCEVWCCCSKVHHPKRTISKNRDKHPQASSPVLRTSLNPGARHLHHHQLKNGPRKHCLAAFLFAFSLTGKQVCVGSPRFGKVSSGVTFPRYQCNKAQHPAISRFGFLTAQPNRRLHTCPSATEPMSANESHQPFQPTRWPPPSGR